MATEKRVSRVVASTSNRAAPVKVNGGPVINLQFAQTEQEAHAKAWEALKRKEREAAIVSVDTLKPAASLTRVDSDTLKVSLQRLHGIPHLKSLQFKNARHQSQR